MEFTNKAVASNNGKFRFYLISQKNLKKCIACFLLYGFWFYDIHKSLTYKFTFIIKKLKTISFNINFVF